MYSRANPPTEEELLGFHTTLSNWGRWGDDDDLGTLNLITQDVRKRGIAAARNGISVSCAWDVPTGGEAGIERHSHLQTFPPESHPWGGVNEDLTFDFHDARFTHLDSLGHFVWQGKMYNGRSSADFDLDVGLTFGSVTAAADGLLTRGVLLDIPALRGVDWLEMNEAVFPEDLDEAEKRQGVRLEPGDAVLVRTGFDRRKHETGVTASGGGQPGLHAACLPWLRERDVAYLCSDTGHDALPSGYPNVFLPIHTVCQVALGMWLVDHCDLYGCAQTAERLQQWDFLLSVSPVRFKVTSGSPVNPIATF